MRNSKFRKVLANRKVVDVHFHAVSGSLDAHISIIEPESKNPFVLVGGEHANQKEINDQIKIVFNDVKKIVEAEFWEGCFCCAKKGGGQVLDVDEMAGVPKIISSGESYSDFFHLVEETDVLWGLTSFCLALPLGLLGLKAAYLNITAAKGTLKNLKTIREDFEKVMPEIDSLIQLDSNNLRWVNLKTNMQALKDGFDYSYWDSISSLLGPGTFTGAASLFVLTGIGVHSPLALIFVSLSSLANASRNIADLYYWNRSNLGEGQRLNKQVNSIEDGQQSLTDYQKGVEILNEQIQSDRYVYLVNLCGFLTSGISAIVMVLLIWQGLWFGQEDSDNPDLTNGTFGSVGNSSLVDLSSSEEHSVDPVGLYLSTGLFALGMITCTVSNNAYWPYTGGIPRNASLDKKDIYTWTTQSCLERIGNLAKKREMLKQYRNEIKMPNHNFSKFGAAVRGAVLMDWGKSKSVKIQEKIYKDYKDKIPGIRKRLLNDLLEISGETYRIEEETPFSVWNAINKLGDFDAIQSILMAENKKAINSDLDMHGHETKDLFQITFFQLLKKQGFSISVTDESPASHSACLDSSCTGHGHIDGHAHGHSHGHGHGHIDGHVHESSSETYGFHNELSEEVLTSKERFSPKDRFDLSDDEIEIAIKEKKVLATHFRKDTTLEEGRDFLRVVDRFYFLDLEGYARPELEEQQLALTFYLYRKSGIEHGNRNSQKLYIEDDEVYGFSDLAASHV